MIEDGAAAISYWRRKLAGAPPALELPVDRPRPPVPSHCVDTVSFVVPPATVARLDDLADQGDGTLFVPTLAAYLVLLGVYARTDDVVVGCPVGAGALPVRARVVGELRYTELLAQVRATVREAFDHRDLPLERLVTELAQDGDTTRHPIFQTWFELGSPDSPDAVKGLDLELRLLPNADGGLTGRLGYATDLFERSTAERLTGHYRTLLDTVSTDPGQRLRSLSLSGPAERERVLYAWNDTGTPVDLGTTVVDEFEHQVRQTPQAVAVIDGERRLSFAELNADANRIAWLLREHGIGPERVVGLLLPRGGELIAAVLGVLKAGGAYLPLDPDYPMDRTWFMLADSGAALVVTTPDRAARLPTGVATVLLPVDGPDRDPPRDTTADNLAYVIYTSGSTGRPKGVAMAHRPLLNLIRWQLDRSPVAGPTLQFAPINFDASFQELFASWLGGGAVVLVTESERRDAGRLLDTMSAAGVRRLICTPMVLDQVAAAATGRDQLPPLDEIVTSGGRLRLGEQVRNLLHRLPGVRLDNQYGPTEVHVMTGHLMTGNPSGWPETPPIGTPIANSRVYVLDDHLQPVPIGVPGELYVGGICLARGYVGRAELTAQRFLPDPFVPAPGARMYRTGDVTSWGDDGLLRFHGRVDDQVKVRGYRIEPSEVSSVLATYPGVREAAVVPVEMVPGDLRLAAYVVPEPGGHDPATPTASALRSYLGERLPEYMVPSYLTFLPALPLSERGKLAREALPRPGREAGSVYDYTAPRGDRETAMITIWAEVIGIAQVGVHDDFFDLGGHSLLAAKITARVNSTFGCRLPLGAVFTHRTVARLTEAVRGAKAAPAPLVPRADSGTVPLSFAQQRLWFLDRVQPGSIAYVLTDTTYRIEGPLDTGALEIALRAVLARHAVLRSRFQEVDGQPRVVFDEVSAVPLLRIDLSAEPDPARAATDHTLASARQPFDLAGPLTRMALLRLGNDLHVLEVTVHHSVFDGLSIQVFEEDLGIAYRAATRNESPSWPPLTVDYADFAGWQRRTLTDAVAAEHVTYWQRKLAGAPSALNLPTDRPRPPVAAQSGATVRFPVPAGTVGRLRTVARQHDTTLFVVALAAYQLLLGRYAEADDVVVGCPSGGRGRPELEALVGLFVNSLPIRADLSGNPPFTDLLRQVRDTTLDAFAHDELPFERLVEKLAPPRALNRSPVIQAWFDLFTSPCRLQVTGAIVERLRIESVTTRFDVELHLREDDTGDLTGDLVYSVDLFDRVTMEKFAEHYTTLLGSIASGPERRTRDLPVASAAELDQLRAWRAGSGTVAPGATVVEQFEWHAAHTPDAVALIAGRTALSFRELDRRATRIARALVAGGVGVETLVAVCLRRTAALPLALLAVAKAGAGYVALDPEQPEHRRRLLVEDSGAVLVITDDATQSWAVPAISLARLEDEGAAESDERALPTAGRTNVLYVVYTSGSTGRPKGVAMHHGPTATLMEWAGRRYLSRPVALLYFPVTSDVCSYELWSTWWTGGCVVLADEADRFDPDRLSRLVERHRVSTVLLTPAVLDELASSHPSRLRSVREIITTGDRLTITEAIRDLGVRLDNQWGSTEVNVVTAHRLVPPGDAWPDTPGIGEPVVGAAIHVLDDDLRPAPVNVPGELYVGGPPLARGYLGRPDLTAAAFVPDPFSAEPGSRMYRTGDRGRWRPDGTLEFLGRRDFQIKIHGYRVEPAEIEMVLGTHDAVRRAAVVAYGTPSGPRLVGYVAARAGTLTPAELRQWLCERLPDYQVPHVCQILDELPTTATGKIDRKALPEPVFAPLVRAVPRNRTDERVLAVWREVLDRDDIGIHDNFFDLGGHSLLCLQVLTRIEHAMAVTVPLRAMFSHRTVAELSDLIAATGQRGSRGD